ncbi:MAG: zf-HC2 domain-containing protein, partial [Armatimonadota bacterium]|nr:zf-HC2 domain-containing protein [Armatimonadota bacterium]
MKCSKVRDKLMDYIAAELPTKEAREVSDHLASCESCRAFLALAQRASKALNYLREEEPAPQVLSSVRQRIDREKVAHRPIPVIRFAVTLSIIFMGGLVVAGWLLRSPLVHYGAKVVKHNEYLEAPMP